MSGFGVQGAQLVILLVVKIHSSWAREGGGVVVTKRYSLQSTDGDTFSSSVDEYDATSEG